MSSRKRPFRNGVAVSRARTADGPSPSPAQGRVAPRAMGANATADSTVFVPSATPGGLPLDQVVQGDCVSVMEALPEASVDLVFADPPFNIGYHYASYDDDKPLEEYLGFSRRWMSAVRRVLKPTGSFFLAIGDEYAADLAVIARRELGFHQRNWIIWHYTFGQQARRSFARSHTHILYFTRSTGGFTFNADAVRVPSARQTTYADARANPRGKLPDDVWFLRPQEAAGRGYFEPTCDTWHISRVCGTFKEREGWHGCQMPIAVLERILLACTNAGDVVLDPFNGSGTTVVAAALLQRRFIGIEQDPTYVDFARKRLAHALAVRGHTGGDVPTMRAVNDGDRESRILTPTDALGRPRVPRQRNRKEAETAARLQR